MFDIGFLEICLIAVVALLVVGPEEFPSLVRQIGLALGKLRRFVTSVKSDFEHEVNKAEELKQMLAKETEIAELHKVIDESKITIAANRQPLSDQGHTRGDAKVLENSSDTLSKQADDRSS